MVERPPAAFRGIDTYRDPAGKFSVRFPSDWHQFELSEERDGVMYAPAAAEPKTWFAVWTAPLEEAAVAEDLELLRDALAEGLAQLPECSVESEADDVIGNLIKFERVYTFREDGELRKRKAWIMYVAEWQMIVMYQAENLEEYEYWLAMANYLFWSFNIPEALWFATDRDLAGYGQTVDMAAEEAEKVEQAEKAAREQPGRSG